MADYKVAQYSSNIFDDGNGYKNIYISCDLLNSGGKVKTHHYRICNDTRYSNINILRSILDSGFESAKNMGHKISISVEDRMYLLMNLPDNNGIKLEHRFTGEKMSEPYYSK